MKDKEFIDKLNKVLKEYKTVYMWGVFGAPVTESIISIKSEQYPNWYTKSKQESLRKLIGKGYYGFDCVNLIKGILWGWDGPNGVPKYSSNGVPDISADGMLEKLTDRNPDFSNIIPGEAVWMRGHIGVYIGDGKVIECTPSWANGVQMTACLNVKTIQGLNGRMWTMHGKLPYIKYSTTSTVSKKYPLTKVGSKGEYVSIIQRIVGVKVDGDFGPLTLAAVRRWQALKGLDADGIVGPKTWAKMITK